MSFTPDAKRVFDETYKKACALNSGDKLVSLMYLMLKLLREAQMGRDTRIQPKQMGVHPKNRSGKKMVPNTMQKKGIKITNVGFAQALCGIDRAIGFEVNPMSKHIEEHTIATTSASPMFAKYEKGLVVGGSVGCGHLNQWLAAVGDSAESSYSDVCDRGETKLSAHLVAKDNVEYELAIEKGIVWFLIKWEIERDYPELPNVIQRGLNVEHHVGEGPLHVTRLSIRFFGCRSFSFLFSFKIPFPFRFDSVPFPVGSVNRFSSATLTV
jgi:hypothetical protein